MGKDTLSAPAQRRQPTARDVARAAGVSVAVVSYAFNRPDRVAAVTRERVLATAAAMGYRGPDPAARALRLGRRGAIALVGGGTAEDLLAEPAAVLVARGLARACDRAGVGLLLSAQDGAAVDGTVAFRRPAPASGLAVLVDRPEAGDTPRVCARVREGVASAAARLRELGHTCLVVVTWPDAGDRLAGAREGWAAAGPLHVVMAPGPQRLDGEPSGRAALGITPRPTAVLALSDPLALEALDAAAHAGLRVPADLSVVGVDDLPGSDAAGLTTVFVPYGPMGELAGGVLAALLEGNAPAQAPELPTELTMRRSAGRAPTRPRP